MPEAALARELGLPYALCAVAVNYAAGRSRQGTSIHAELEASIGVGMERVAALLGSALPAIAATM